MSTFEFRRIPCLIQSSRYWGEWKLLLFENEHMISHFFLWSSKTEFYVPQSVNSIPTWMCLKVWMTADAAMPYQFTSNTYSLTYFRCVSSYHFPPKCCTWSKKYAILCMYLSSWVWRIGKSCIKNYLHLCLTLWYLCRYSWLFN